MNHTKKPSKRQNKFNEGTRLMREHFQDILVILLHIMKDRGISRADIVREYTKRADADRTHTYQTLPLKEVYK